MCLWFGSKGQELCCDLSQDREEGKTLPPASFGDPALMERTTSWV